MTGHRTNFDSSGGLPVSRRSKVLFTPANSVLASARFLRSLSSPSLPMHLSKSLLSSAVCSLAGLTLLLTGCANAEKKLGRGITNLTEPLRLGEMQYAYEQSYLYDGASVASSRGFIHGINRTIARTAVGAFEVVTFPIPTGPYIKPDGVVYPDSFKPGPTDSSTITTDRVLGFDGQDVAPFIPGSRFTIFGE